MIRIEHMRKEYETVTPLEDVSVTINKGDIISIIGPSGTGKSTFIRCLNLLERPTSGKIFIDDEEITAPNANIEKLRMKMGMVFQSFNLFNHMTVIENLMAPQMDNLGRTKQEAYDRSYQLLKNVSLEDKVLSYPTELSGGQKQRVAICRALAMEPEIILFDEPTSALDPTMINEVQSVIRDLALTGTTMIIVTHEMTFAQSIANRVFYMDDGGIYEEGSSDEIFLHPKKELTKKFIFGLRTLKLSITSKNYDYLALNSEFEAFIRKNQIRYDIANQIRHVYEEMLTLLISKLDTPQIHMQFEYHDEKSPILSKIAYNGEPFDIEESEDELSLRILHKFISDYEYRLVNGEKLRNEVSFKIIPAKQ